MDNRYERYIGIDFGTKRIGLARTDLLRTFANPLGTYGRPEVYDVLKNQVENERVTTFVVGWPLTPEGEEGDFTEVVDGFIRELKTRFPDIEVVRMDERYTSKKAVKAMVEAGVPKMKRRDKARVDRAAAALILQQYLELSE